MWRLIYHPETAVTTAGPQRADCNTHMANQVDPSEVEAIMTMNIQMRTSQPKGDLAKVTESMGPVLKECSFHGLEKKQGKNLVQSTWCPKEGASSVDV